MYQNSRPHPPSRDRQWWFETSEFGIAERNYLINNKFLYSVHSRALSNCNGYLNSVQCLHNHPSSTFRRLSSAPFFQECNTSLNSTFKSSLSIVVGSDDYFHEKITRRKEIQLSLVVAYITGGRTEEISPSIIFELVKLFERQCYFMRFHARFEHICAYMRYAIQSRSGVPVRKSRIPYEY